MLKKYDLVDVFRVFAAISVVLIHSWPVGSYSSSVGNIVVALSRYAVPFFFIVTGFFVSKSLAKRNDNSEYFGYIKKYTTHFLALCYLVGDLYSEYSYKVEWEKSICELCRYGIILEIV
ncbi:acyltransferase family protein [Weissella cibaria]